MAIITTPLPYIFSNGSTADATQVNADLNQIIAGVNANAAASGVNGDITSLTALTTLTVSGAITGGSITGAGTGLTGTAASLTAGTASALTAANSYTINGSLTLGANPAGPIMANAVAFRAYRSTSQTSGSTIIFDTVENQTGGTNYSNSTGVFTAPVTGWYSFQYSLEITNNSGASQSLYTTLRVGVNDEAASGARSTFYATNMTVSLAASAVVFLSSGGTVQVLYNASASMPVNAQSHTSSFSGALIARTA